MALIQLNRTKNGAAPTSLADGELYIDQLNGWIYYADATGVVRKFPITGRSDFATKAGDADTLDGNHAAAFALAGHTHPVPAPTATVLGGVFQEARTDNSQAVVGVDTTGKLQFATVDAKSPIGNILAWVNFDGVKNDSLKGTYTQSGASTITVKIVDHGLMAGHVARLDFTSGTATDGTFTVVVVDKDTFTVQHAVKTTSGNVTLMRNTIRASSNVSSVADRATGKYTINFTTPFPDDKYIATGMSGKHNRFVSVDETGQKTTNTMSIAVVGTDGSVRDDDTVYLMVIR